MDVIHFIAAAMGLLLAHTMWRLWRSREAPGALPCLLLFAALAVYLPSVLAYPQPVLMAQAGYLAAGAITPLLFVSVCDYAALRIPGGIAVRVAAVFGVMAAAGFNIVADHGAVFQAIATADDLESRSIVIRAARQGPLMETTVLSYLFTGLTVVAAAVALIRSPARRRDLLVLVSVCVAVAAVDLAHYRHAFTIAGIMPTPLAIMAGILVATALLHRSSMFDLRPIARSVLLESVQDAMLVVDDQHRLVDLNRAAEKLIDTSRRECLGRPAAGLLPREFAAMLQSTVHLRAELAVQLHELHQWFEVDATPLTLRGRRAGHLLLARDITERRQVQEALEQSRRALEAANARLVEQSVTDPLTGLKNRRFLFQRLNEEINRHHRAGEVLGLLVVDLDHFKRVNDTHGHPMGDEALIQVAATLTGSVRDCDVVARLGGEEFAVLAVNTEVEGLVNLAERIRCALAATPVARTTRQPMILTASIGVAFAGPGSRSAEGLFAEADRYLYQAKRGGRNRVVSAEPEPLPAATDDRRMRISRRRRAHE